MNASISFGLGGIAGWKVLQRMEERQKEVLARDPVIQRQTGHFRDRLEITGTAEELVGDYRMLSVALGAFGLHDDIGNKAFIKKVLESDLDDRKSLANRLTDKRYLRLAEAFGFHDRNAQTEHSEDAKKPTSKADLADRISSAFLDREFERRVGLGDESLRLALNAQREIESFSTRDSSDKTLWYEVLGSPPLRKVFETAFGYGTQFGKLPVDRQLKEMMKGAERLIGSSSFKTMAEPENTGNLIRNFLVRSEIATITSQNRFSAALALLSQ